MGAINKDGIDCLSDLRKAHHTKHRWSTRDRLPLSATLGVTSTLQCGRCLGYLHPHNPRGRNVQNV